MADGWTVVKQEQTIAKLPDDTFGPVVRITFRTTAGIVRSIDVPVAEYNAATVAERIDNAAKETDAIQNL